MALVGTLAKIGLNLAQKWLWGTASRAPDSAQPGNSFGPVPRRRPRVIYPGDFVGTAQVRYRPVADGQPDPGEVVWTWVPFEEDHSQGKDRPVLVVGFEGKWLLALMLSSKDRAPRGGVDRHQGREWLDVGPGPWDPRGRPSEVRLNRVLRVAPETVRREGAQLEQLQFALVAEALQTRYGWL